MKYSIKTLLMFVGFTCCVASCGRDESPMVKGGEGAQSPSPVLVDSAPVPEFESEIKETQDKVTSGEASQQVAEDLEPPVEPIFSAAEVALHNGKADCWIIIGDSVYDITDFFESHPGGEAPVRFCGRDATAIFSRIHAGSEGAGFMAQQYRIGRLMR
jgi:hypothetical protein